MRQACILAVLLTSAASAATISLDAGTALVLGDQAEVSANLFGLTAFEGFTAVVGNRDYRARVAALRPGVVRLPGVVSWFAPDKYDPAWYDTPEAAAQFQTTLLMGARYPGGRFLPVARELGLEPMVSLGNPPAYLAQEGTGNPTDFARWAELCAAYVGLCRKFDPKLRLVQVWNEPNASWFRDPRVQPGFSEAALHIEMANLVSRAIKGRFPDIQVGGPVLCWPPSWPAAQPGMAPWYTWDLWTIPWLRGTKDTVDFFDFHVYNVAPADFQVQCEMVAAAARALQGRELPIWITESNYDLTAEERADPATVWRQRVLPYERLLLRGMLPQADKVAGNLVHDLAAGAFRVLGDPDEPEQMYWLLWVLRDLRGRRLLAECDDPALAVFATLEEDRVTLVAFNDGPEPKELSLRLAVPGGWWTGPEVRALGPNAQGVGERLTLQADLKHEPPGATGSLTLPPFATASLSLHLDHFPQPGRSRVVTEHFAEQTLQFLEGTAPARMRVALPEGEHGQVALRLGLLGTEGTEQLVARLNGRELPLQAVAIQDVPLAAADLKPDNDLQITLRQAVDNPRLAVGFASLVTTAER